MLYENKKTFNPEEYENEEMLYKMKETFNVKEIGLKGSSSTLKVEVEYWGSVIGV